MTSKSQTAVDFGSAKGRFFQSILKICSESDVEADEARKRELDSLDKEDEALKESEEKAKVDAAEKPKATDEVPAAKSEMDVKTGNLACNMFKMLEISHEGILCVSNSLVVLWYETVAESVLINLV